MPPRGPRRDARGARRAGGRSTSGTMAERARDRAREQSPRRRGRPGSARAPGRAPAASGSRPMKTSSRSRAHAAACGPRDVARRSAMPSASRSTRVAAVRGRVGALAPRARRRRGRRRRASPRRPSSVAHERRRAPPERALLELGAPRDDLLARAAPARRASPTRRAPSPRSPSLLASAFFAESASGGAPRSDLRRPRGERARSPSRARGRPPRGGRPC